MERFEHIQLTSTNDDEVRLVPVVGFLAGRLSPYDLKIIKRLNNWKGVMEVYLDEKEYDHAVNFAGQEYHDHLMKICKEAWSIVDCDSVNFEFE